MAHRFVNGFDDPSDYEEYFFDPAKTAAYLKSVADGPPR